MKVKELLNELENVDKRSAVSVAAIKDLLRRLDADATAVDCGELWKEMLNEWEH